jgi:hypothetical protein
MDVALAFRHASETPALDALQRDPDEAVRAAVFVARLLRGESGEAPASYGISRAAAAAAVRRAVQVDELRNTARNERDPQQRAAAALALAVLDDEVAYIVMRTDPLWAIRDRVGRMLNAWREPPDARRHA